MAKDSDKLKLGKGAAFQKAALKRLPQQDETWEADFQMLPKPMGQSETHYLGLVVTRNGDEPLAESRVEGRPSVNDLAALLAAATKKPSAGKSRRPDGFWSAATTSGGSCYRTWRNSTSRYRSSGSCPRSWPSTSSTSAASVMNGPPGQRNRRTPNWRSSSCSRRLRSGSTVTATSRSATMEGFGFVVRALDYGGLVFEDDRPMTFAAALASLEAGLQEWFRREQIEVPESNSDGVGRK